MGEHHLPKINALQVAAVNRLVVDHHLHVAAAKFSRIVSTRSNKTHQHHSLVVEEQAVEVPPTLTIAISSQISRLAEEVEEVVLTPPTGTAKHLTRLHPLAKLLPTK